MKVFGSDLDYQLIEPTKALKTEYHCHVIWNLSSPAKLILGCRGNWIYKDGQWMV